jgi:hypothetical protein
MADDALSDILRTVRLTGATFFNCACRAPWVAESPPEEIILPMVLPGGEHLIAYQQAQLSVTFRVLPRAAFFNNYLSPCFRYVLAVSGRHAYYVLTERFPHGPDHKARC